MLLLCLSLDVTGLLVQKCDKRVGLDVCSLAIEAQKAGWSYLRAIILDLGAEIMF